MSILDQWEAAAKGFHETLDPNPIGRFYTRDLKDERILALIDLVRKKDEILVKIAAQNMTYDEIPAECRWAAALGREALALTEELKS